MVRLYEIAVMCVRVRAPSSEDAPEDADGEEDEMDTDAEEEEEEEDAFKTEDIKKEAQTPKKSPLASRLSAMQLSPVRRGRGHSCNKSLVCFCICVSSV